MASNTTQLTDDEILGLVALATDYDDWLTLVRFGLPTLVDRQGLLMKVIGMRLADVSDDGPIMGKVIRDLGLRLTIDPVPPVGVLGGYLLRRHPARPMAEDPGLQDYLTKVCAAEDRNRKLLAVDPVSTSDIALERAARAPTERLPPMPSMADEPRWVEEK